MVAHKKFIISYYLCSVGLNIFYEKKKNRFLLFFTFSIFKELRKIEGCKDKGELGGGGDW